MSESKAMSPAKIMREKKHHQKRERTVTRRSLIKTLLSTPLTFGAGASVLPCLLARSAFAQGERPIRNLFIYPYLA